MFGFDRTKETDKRMDKKKQAELNCYNTMLSYVQHRFNKQEREYFSAIMPLEANPQQSEKPDFIINTDVKTYLIEHFLIDFCYDGPKKNQSKSKLEKRNIEKIFNTYHDPTLGTIADEDKDEALSDIEAEINSITNISNTFIYKEYCDAFNNTFSDHYRKIESYKNNSLIENDQIKIGFLIEFHCNTFRIGAKRNGSSFYFHTIQPAFPMTKDIIDIIVQAHDLDFVIISQYSEGVPMDAKSVRIIEPNNSQKSLNVQRIKVYDEVFYPELNMRIELNREE